MTDPNDVEDILNFISIPHGANAGEARELLSFGYLTESPWSSDPNASEKLDAPALYRLRPFTFATLQARVFGNQGEGATG